MSLDYGESSHVLMAVHLPGLLLPLLRCLRDLLQRLDITEQTSSAVEIIARPKGRSQGIPPDEKRG